MVLPLKFLIVLAICAIDQDTTTTKTNYPDTSSRESKKCVVKQDRINKIAQKVNIKLDSISIKYDKRIEEILKMLEDEKDD